MNFLTAVGAFFYGLFATVFSLLASPLRRAAVGRGNSNRRSATAIFALVVIVGSMALLLMSRCRSTPKDETAAFTALGQMVAQETSKLLASRGQIVLVVPNTEGASKSPALDVIESFRGELKKIGTVKAVATETIGNSDVIMMIGPAIAANDYRMLMEKYPSVDALVSFVGAPSGDSASLDRLPATRPKLVAVCSTPVGLKRLFKTGVLQLAVVPRFETVTAPAQKPETPSQRIERYFQVVNAQNAESLPN